MKRRERKKKGLSEVKQAFYFDEMSEKSERWGSGYNELGVIGKEK